MIISLDIFIIYLETLLGESVFADKIWLDLPLV